MKKILFTSALAFAVFSTAIATGADKETVYFSPNNDGTKDVLEIPIQIKEKRYVKSWSLVIENESGEIVRTVENKDKRDAKLTFKGFWKALFTPKNGVAIPSTVSWNGVMDNGEIAPDGNYRYYMTATDDNGNTGMTDKLSVVVDNTPPEIALAKPSDDGKIFGEGAKVLFPVEQSGSNEEEWTGVFLDVRGNPVKTIKWTKSEPLKFEWNGTDDTGLPLPDGVYSYKISSTDKAGNYSEDSIPNIIYSAEKPATNIAITEGKYFSPQGNSSTKEIKFDVKIPVPDERSGNKLTEWSVKIIDDKGTVYRTFFGTDNPPKEISWNGKTDSGEFVKEGNSYQAAVKAKYLNGYETAPLSSPLFTLDNTEPKAKIAAKNLTFSPDGDGNLDAMEIEQTFPEDPLGSPIEDWKGKLVNARGETVKEVDFGAFPPATFSWDGLDNDSKLVEDGTYKYVLAASDKAGNTSEISVADIKLDTSKTELLLNLNKTAFNPDRPADIRITPVVKSSSKITSYALSIMDEGGNEVWKQEGSFLPASFTWTGKGSDNATCKDGQYTAVLNAKSENGSSSSVKSQKFLIDTVPPAISLAPKFTHFSPDSDGQKDAVPIEVKSSAEESWTARVYNSKNESVKTYTWKGEVPSFDFDGTDSKGNILPDGTYKIVFTSEDAAGNKSSEEIPNVVVDNREAKAYVTAESQAFSPNGDGKFDTQKFTIKNSLNDGIESWKFSIATADGKVVKSWTNETLKDIPSSLVWDGTGDDGKAVEDNVYTARLNIDYEKGNKVDTVSPAFISCVTPPKAAVKTKPEYFSPDNDGEDDDLFIQLKADTLLPLKSWSFQINDPKGAKFWSTSGKSSITEQIKWDGRSNNKSNELVQSAMDYPYTFTVTDSLGMTSTVEGIIPIDILVVPDGDKLKMAVPSIIFRSDAADFKGEGEPGVAKGKGLSKEQIANNERILKRIAVVLNKFKSYKVTVEGHANSMSGTAAEEEGTNVALYGPGLKQLSKERADFVRKQLVKYGVSSSRLSAVGMGGTQPIVDRTDKANNWKNRRVEFILIK